MGLEGLFFSLWPPWSWGNILVLQAELPNDTFNYKAFPTPIFIPWIPIPFWSPVKANYKNPLVISWELTGPRQSFSGLWECPKRSIFCQKNDRSLITVWPVWVISIWQSRAQTVPRKACCARLWPLGPAPTRAGVSLGPAPRAGAAGMLWMHHLHVVLELTTGYWGQFN